MTILPTWLYHATEAPKLVHDQAEHAKAVKDGFRDSPRYFNGTEPEAPKAETTDESAFASKQAEKLALENGLSPEEINKADAEGKITVSDVKAALKAKGG